MIAVLVVGLRRFFAPLVYAVSLTRDAIEISCRGQRETVPVEAILDMRVSAEDLAGFAQSDRPGLDPLHDQRHYLAFRTASGLLVVPGLPEETARSLDDLVRSSLRELRGATR